jgi:cell pole-organizing protein PopZ
MTQAAKAQEPSMEEILASIRRIIADDDGAKKPEAKPEAKVEPPAAKAPPPKPAPVPPPPAAMKQDDIDAMLAGLGDPEPEPPPARERAPEPDVLELTEAMQAPAAPTFRTIDAQQDVVFDEASVSEPPPPPPPPRAAEPPRAAPPPRPPVTAEPDIMSSATAAAVDSAFNALAHTVLVQNAKTLEDLVKEMLRPMLQHWLDNNLPTLVERLVRQEIERVARGRG